jgi:chaperonin GroES
MKLRPLRDNVLISRAEADSETEGGLIIPDDAKTKSQHGEVIAVGPGAFLDNGERQPLGVKVGDVVYFSAYVGTEVELDGEPFVLMSEADIAGVVEEP